MARIVVAPVLLTTSAVSAHVVNTGVQATMEIVTFWNSDTVAREVHMFFVPSGGSEADANQILGTEGGNIVPAGESRTYKFNHFLAPGDFISMKASIAAKVSARLSVLEEAPA